jgi:hypothetical protein
MVKIGDKIKTKFGIGTVTDIYKEKDRYVIYAEYPIKLPIMEGDEEFEVL